MVAPKKKKKIIKKKKAKVAVKRKTAIKKPVKKTTPLHLNRSKINPIIEPVGDRYWE